MRLKKFALIPAPILLSFTFYFCKKTSVKPQSEEATLKSIYVQIACPCDCKKPLLSCSCPPANQIKEDIKTKLKKGMKPEEILNHYKSLYGEKITEETKTEKAYLIAKNRGEMLNEFPCYCGCMENESHKGLYDCFYKEGEIPNEHGSECDICIDEVIKVDEEIKKGTKREEIKIILKKEFE